MGAKLRVRTGTENENEIGVVTVAHRHWQRQRIDECVAGLLGRDKICDAGWSRKMERGGEMEWGVTRRNFQLPHECNENVTTEAVTSRLYFKSGYVPDLRAESKRHDKNKV
ncbi:hypothetical protein EVAR_93821_1 [Eumeta japonica]|uniref:Uncharacterized protein n=1 Tax=Eumeta variegata TaxID=151549 RepID=A0A4C1VAI6_EUMVA|nr:hypothetical protein EVAR_93821_1 [Eumeta japonica]